MSSRDQRDWKQFLAHRVQRDGVVEIAPRGATENETRKVYKSRLFKIEADGAIIVERPDGSVIDHAFSIGDTVELLLVVNNQRMLGDCKLLRIEVQQINRSTRVTCLRLSPAARVRINQRRAFFRVNTAAADLGPVVLRAEKDAPEQAVSGRMVNLGGGGVGVAIRAGRDVLRQVQQQTRYHCRIEVESDDSVLDLTANLVHISPLDTTGLYLGLEFELPGGAAGKQIENQIMQYAAWLQRRQLQRRRA